MCSVCLLDWPHMHTNTLYNVCVCVEKKSLRHIMYTATRSPKPRVSLHLVFNCYKLSHLTPSSLPLYKRPGAISAHKEARLQTKKINVILFFNP